jgi:3D (Asp-Asp-Asp) domain-containing protein
MNPSRLLPLPLLLALVVAGCSTTTQTTSRRATGQRMTVRTTAYTHTEPGGIRNAIGSRLKYGDGLYSAASDWSWLPLGTRFRMVEDGRLYVIEDYGSALVGRKTIDLYMPSMRQVNRWGVRYKEIEILEWGSKAMSLKLLAPRSRNRHVAVMVAQLRRDGVKPSG